MRIKVFLSFAILAGLKDLVNTKSIKNVKEVSYVDPLRNCSRVTPEDECLIEVEGERTKPLSGKKVESAAKSLFGVLGRKRKGGNGGNNNHNVMLRNC